MSAADPDRAQAAIGEEISSSPIGSRSTGLRVDPPALSAQVQGHHDGLEARLRSLVDVPIAYTETDGQVVDLRGAVPPTGASDLPP